MRKLADIPDNKINAYLRIPKEQFEGCSDDIFIGIADGGNHFLEYGITEGTK